MSLNTAERTQLLGRIAADREFRQRLLSSPRKAAHEIGIALSEVEEHQILSGLRELRESFDRTDRLLGSALMAPFVFAVLLTHDDGGDENEPPPDDGKSRRGPRDDVPLLQ